MAGRWSGLLIVLLLLFVTACAAETPLFTQGPPLLPAAGMRSDTAVVERGPVTAVRYAEGLVRMHAYHLSFGGQSGAFGRFYVFPGQAVYEGQLLARLCIAAVERRIEELEQQLTAMRTRHAQDYALQSIAADMLYMQYQRMMREAAGRFDTAAMLAAQSVGLDADRALLQLTLLRQNFGYYTAELEAEIQAYTALLTERELHAPFCGRITYIDGLTPGDMLAAFAPVMSVAPYGAELFIEHICTEPVSFWLGQDVRGYFAGETHALTMLPLSAEQAAFYRRTLHRLPVRFALPDTDPPPVGTLVALSIYTWRLEDTLRLPRNAVLPNPDGGYYVYRQEGGYWVPTLLNVTFWCHSYAAIPGGLTEGDVVLVR